MHLYKLPVTLFFLFFLSITGNAQVSEEKMKEIASAYCSCMSDTTTSISADTKQLLLKSATAEDPQKGLTEAIQNLPDDKKALVAMDLMNLATTPMGICLSETDAKYESEQSGNKKAFVEKLISILKNKQGCKLAAAFMQLGIASLDEE